ncbi:MAG: hypothetical protein NTW49_08175 [Bacteroidia bacterium]|nr:hypothetical protein [Bacteroidia bacterium]
MKIQFEICTDNIVEFAELLSENDMDNQIAGSTEEGNLLVNVICSRGDRDVLDQLEELAESDE